MNANIEISTLDNLVNAGYSVLVNGDVYQGRYAVGDVLEVNGLTYVIQAINDDAILVRDLTV